MKIKKFNILLKWLNINKISNINNQPLNSNSWLAGFIDAGNVWKWHQTPAAAKFEKANFDFRRFYKEIAVGTPVQS
jgi:hypothetical protein